MRMKCECGITQLFGGNANPLYHGQGLKGHPAFDEQCGYGTTIHSYYPGYVHSVLYPNTETYDYSCVYQIVETEFEVFEYGQGHVSKVLVAPDSTTVAGQPIAEEGNFGAVYFNGIEVSVAERKAGSHAGTHRHVQKRAVKKVTKTTPGKQYLSSPQYGNPFRKDGYYFEYFDQDNGYNACVDPLAPLFARDLTYGATGWDVWCLQLWLVKRKFGAFDPTGFYGDKTTAAVIALQNYHSIGPAQGYFGPKTRAALGF